MANDKLAKFKGRVGNGKDRHVRLYHWVTDTPAWRDLDAVARCAYVEMLRRYNGSNNGRIGFGVRCMGEALNVAPKTAARALRALEAHGFIVTVKRGAFSRKVKHASEYRLTEFKCDLTNTLAHKDFTRWQKNTVVEVTPVGGRGDTER